MAHYHSTTDEKIFLENIRINALDNEAFAALCYDFSGPLTSFGLAFQRNRTDYPGWK